MTFNPRFGAPSQLGVRPVAQLSAAFLSQAFLWMFVGLGLTAGVGVLIAGLSDEQLVNLTPLVLPVLIGQLILAMAFIFAIRRISTSVAFLLFFVYAATMGLSVGLALKVYDLGSVVAAAGSASVMFGGAALYGSTTKRSLASIGGYLFMGLIGIIAASVINWFLGWQWLSFGISILGVAIFTALTAYDVQRIQHGDIAASVGSMEKGAIFAAFMLYLDFINLFFFLLRLFGSSRN